MKLADRKSTRYEGGYGNDRGGGAMGGGAMGGGGGGYSRGGGGGGGGYGRRGIAIDLFLSAALARSKLCCRVCKMMFIVLHTLLTRSKAVSCVMHSAM